MTVFLNNHPSGYSLTCGEFFSSAAFPPLSASTYANRHREAANALNDKGESALCHRTIEFLEYIPVIGILVAIIERIVACFFSLLCCKEEEAKEPTPDLTHRSVQEVEDTHSVTSLADTALNLSSDGSSTNQPADRALEVEVESTPSSLIPPGSPFPVIAKPESPPNSPQKTLEAVQLSEAEAEPTSSSLTPPSSPTPVIVNPKCLPNSPLMATEAVQSSDIEVESTPSSLTPPSSPSSVIVNSKSPPNSPLKAAETIQPSEDSAVEENIQSQVDTSIPSAAAGVLSPISPPRSSASEKLSQSASPSPKEPQAQPPLSPPSQTHLVTPKVVRGEIEESTEPEPNEGNKSRVMFGESTVISLPNTNGSKDEKTRRGLQRKFQETINMGLARRESSSNKPQLQREDSSSNISEQKPPPPSSNQNLTVQQIQKQSQVKGKEFDKLFGKGKK